MIRSLHLAAAVKEQAALLGFNACGIAAAGPSLRRDYVRRWLDDGKHADMAWLANRFDERTDVQTYLPGAASVIVVALSYNIPLDAEAEASDAVAKGRIARYALGTDYHAHIKSRLHTLADWLKAETSCETRACVDTAPVLEREWAARAGVGWQGKNTLALDTKLGSYLLLGEIITTAELAPDGPAVDRCGTCTRCIDACPTDALTPYQLDARRCISYWTIEHRGDIESIPSDIRHGTGDWLFGCDICQEVCPWNRKAAAATDPLVQPRPGLESGTLDAAAVIGWTHDDYLAATRKSAMRRVKLPQLQRNARVVLENDGASS